jgi:hypothetical protein
MMFLKDTFVAVKRPLLVWESELPLRDLFRLIAATSKAGSKAAAGAEVWPKDVTASDAVAMSNSFATKDASKAIRSVGMDAMLLLAMGAPLAIQTKTWPKLLVSIVGGILI